MLPATTTGGDVTIPVAHFSVSGTGAVLPPELANLALPVGGSREILAANLLLLLNNNATRAQVVDHFNGWYNIIEARLLLSSSSTPELLDGVADFAFWDAVIAYASGARPDLAGLVHDEPLHSAYGQGQRHMVLGIYNGIARASLNCRAGLEYAAVALFWQEEAVRLGVDGIDFVEIDGRPDLGRTTVLDFIREHCVEVLLESSTLADPLEAGTSYVFEMRFRIHFANSSRMHRPGCRWT